MRQTVPVYIAFGKCKDQLDKKEAFLLKVMDDIKRRISEEDVLKYSLYVKEGYYARILADQKRPIETIYGNYDDVIALYKEQIESRSDSYWSDGPRKALMEIYRLQGNTVAYNDELYNMMLEHTGDDKYYLEYKALFGAQQWKSRLLLHMERTCLNDIRSDV